MTAGWPGMDDVALGRLSAALRGREPDVSWLSRLLLAWMIGGGR